MKNGALSGVSSFFGSVNQVQRFLFLTAHVQVALENTGFYARDILVYRRSSGIPKGINIKKQLERKGYENPEQWEGWHSCLRNEWESICVLQKPLVHNYIETLLDYGTGLFYTKDHSGGFQSNILEGISREKDGDFNVHCTVKPIALMKKLVEIFVPLLKDSTLSSLILLQTQALHY